MVGNDQQKKNRYKPTSLTNLGSDNDSESYADELSAIHSRFQKNLLVTSTEFCPWPHRFPGSNLICGVGEGGRPVKCAAGLSSFCTLGRWERGSLPVPPVLEGVEPLRLARLPACTLHLFLRPFPFVSRAFCHLPWLLQREFFMRWCGGRDGLLRRWAW